MLPSIKWPIFVAIICLPCLSIAGEYIFALDFDRLPIGEAEPNISITRHNTFSDFLEEIQVLSDNHKIFLGEKFILRSTYLNNISNFLNISHLRVNNGDVVIEVLSYKNYRMSVWVKKIVMSFDFGKEYESSIVEIPDKRIFNYVLSCSEEICTGDIFLKKPDNNWQTIQQLSTAEVEAFKREMRSIFWVIE